MKQHAVSRPGMARGLHAAFAQTGDVNDTINRLQDAFATFRQQNDQRIAQIEARGSADIVTVEQVDRLNAQIGELQASLQASQERQAALNLNGQGDGDPVFARNHRQAFDSYFRTGDTSALVALRGQGGPRADLNGLSSPDGGWLLPTQYEQAIERVLGVTSVMRQLATVLPINAPAYVKHVNQGGATATWVGEKEARAKTDTPELSELRFDIRNLYAYPKTTQELLDDAIIDIAAWLASEIDMEFAESEGDAYINGNGLKKPKGILSYDKVANTSYAWGKTGFIASGSSSALTGDGMHNLVYGLKRGYRANGTLVSNDKTFAAIRLLKDGQGNYLWQPSFTAGEPATVLGYPIETDDNMPDVAANAYPIAFGDFRRGYLICDRPGLLVRRDDITEPGFVKFYTYKRTTGGIQNFEAIKLLKIAS